MSERGDGDRIGGAYGGAQRPGGQGLRVRLPLFDRLMDDEPRKEREDPPTPAQAMEKLRAAVRRDLEALLNARRRRWPLPEDCPELLISPFGYGIPDATSGAYSLPERRRALALEVERMIRRFEPRLISVTVKLRDEGNELDRTLRLKIDATLRADPVPEHIAFETVIEAVSHDVIVAGGE